ncbi:hypothetical protein [Ferribacterium limneticum]|uniref:hypothetical protein n=1 Tax=Ferribacterium limneticum TaxID=76259 RepID=UPI001CF9DB39|nr:hypothetical protein [Ferribacterium limneticum]UCV27579.1 hypothetical protein KI617_15060 [Ferribacterium limneticum]UCV31496.1 hypothetical protein KI608_15060 [Ferribacterium limneticum]
MANKFPNHAFVNEFAVFLIDLEEKEIGQFFGRTKAFMVNYARGYELPGPIRLVLDNSLIQAYKHKKTDRSRGIDALAYTAFCRFVSGWSDRSVCLVLSPMAIYEHLGRRLPASLKALECAVEEVFGLLSDTRLPVRLLGFDDGESLLATLTDIAADEAYLTDFVKNLDKANWQADLKAPIGVKIPLSIAMSSLPESMPLCYFSKLYVNEVLASRIEQHIVRQSNHDPAARPICSGELSKSLAALNTFKKNGLFKGLGDIDILSICDVSRQFQQSAGDVWIGQTLDKGLAEVLVRRHIYSVSRGVDMGHPEKEKQISAMLELMRSNPFSEQDRLAERLRPMILNFLDTLVDVCKAATL